MIVRTVIFQRMALLSSVLVLNTIPVLAADVWTIDPTHSSANFSIKHMVISNVRGSFGKLKGSAKYDGNSLKGADVQAIIDVSSINTNDEKRDGHLKSPDFFDVAKFPTIAFKSNKVVPSKNGFDIDGTLTMHGVTKPIVLHAEPLSKEVKDPYGNTRVGTSATATINRKDFGISFNANMDNGGAVVGDEVNITLAIELTKDQPSKKTS
jgi:polyisoprenoid-binding protein YceI